MGFANVNFLSIIVAALAAFVFAAIYYTALVGKYWLAAMGKTMEQVKAENAANSALRNTLPFLLALVGDLIIGWVIYGILVHLHTFTLRAGLLTAAFCWFGFALTTMTVNNAFAMRSYKLTLIDGAGWLGVFLIIGGIVGWWGQ